MNLSSLTHNVVFNDRAESWLPRKSDTRDGQESVPLHICVVAGVDTTHGIANAALLHSTAGVDTPHFELIALVGAAKWVQRTFAPSDLPQKLLLFTDSVRVYLPRRADPHSHTRRSLAISLQPSRIYTLTQHICYDFLGTCPPGALKGNKWANGKTRHAARKSTALNALTITTGNNASLPVLTTVNKIAKQTRWRIPRYLSEER